MDADIAGHTGVVGLGCLEPIYVKTATFVVWIVEGQRRVDRVLPTNIITRRWRSWEQSHNCCGGTS